MSPTEDPSHKHQVGITNAQEENKIANIGDLTRQMNERFAAGDFAEGARIAMEITAQGAPDLRETFDRHGVNILHLDPEALGIYGVIEPSYDLRVDGATPKVLAAAMDFGKRHEQEAVLIARKLEDGEADTDERLGLVIFLHQDIKIDEAVEIAEVVRDCGFAGATFVPKRGEISIFHTTDLEMTEEQFQKAADLMVHRLRSMYNQAQLVMQKFIIQMPRLRYPLP